PGGRAGGGGVAARVAEVEDDHGRDDDEADQYLREHAAPPRPAGAARADDRPDDRPADGPDDGEDQRPHRRPRGDGDDETAGEEGVVVPAGAGGGARRAFRDGSAVRDAVRFSVGTVAAERGTVNPRLPAGATAESEVVAPMKH